MKNVKKISNASMDAAALAKANSILFNVSEKMAGESNYDALLPVILAEACNSLGAYWGIIREYRPETETLNILCTMLNGNLTSTLPGYMYDKSHPVPVEDLYDWPEIFESATSTFYLASLENVDSRAARGVKAWLDKTGGKTLIVSALKLGGKLIGLFGLGFDHEKKIIDSENNVFKALAQQATLAMHLSHLAQAVRKADFKRAQIEHEKRRLEVNDLANKITYKALAHLGESFKLEEYIGEILTVCVNEFNAVGGSAWLLSPDTGKYKILANIENGSLKINTDVIHPGLMGADPFLLPQKSYEKGKIYVFREPQFQEHTSYGPYRKFLMKRNIKTIIATPLFLSEELAGMLTFRFAVERGLSETEKQLIHMLASRTVLTTELARLSKKAQDSAVLQERHRLAREIHDGIAQAFLGISMQLEHIKSHESIVDPEPIKNALEAAQQGVGDVRRAIDALRPNSLNEHTFPEAIQQLLERQMNCSGLTYNVELSGTWVPLHPNCEEQLFRITQEAVNNILKHSRAHSFNVEISCTTRDVSVLISDNGIGFLVAPKKFDEQGGFGLHSMQQRADLIGAELAVVSIPGTGTQVLISLDKK